MPRHFTLFFSFLLFGCVLHAQPGISCHEALEFCSKGKYKIKTFPYFVSEGFSEKDFSCFQNATYCTKPSSIWVTFQASTAGDLLFTLTPEQVADDLDFVVFRIGEDCKKRTTIRCMAAGDTDADSPCFGATGLKANAYDKNEDAGCSIWSDDNWLMPISAKAGDRFVLVIINTTNRSRELHFELYGTASLPCELAQK